MSSIAVPSKTRVNRAGSRLVDAYQNGDPWPEEEVEIVTAWRSLHAEPVSWLADSLRRRTHEPVAYRLKRLPQIVAKLARAGNMNLARMQDLGGYRVVVESDSDGDRLLQSVQQHSSPHYEVKVVTDYRESGRADTGYRAIHLVLLREERQIELQIRSRRQHGWAEAVERAANRTGFKLKDGEGPPAVVEYFRVASDVLRALDCGRSPDPGLTERARELRGELVTYLKPPTRNEHFSISATNPSGRGSSWLLVFDWRNGKRLHWTEVPTSPGVAAQRFAEWEDRYKEHEVVLIGSDSPDTIRWTHAHYFGRSPDDLDPHGVLEEIAA